MDSGVILW